MLRNYQQKAVDSIPNGDGKFLLVLPAGSGKSHIINALSNKNATIVCHRNILLEQLKKHGCKGRIVSRHKLFNNPDTNSTLIIDECHSVNIIGQYADIFKRYKKVIGLTATPFRLDCGHISNVGWQKVYEIEESSLIKQGFLCPIKHKKVPFYLIMNIEQVEYNDNKKLVKKAKSYIDRHVQWIKENVDLTKHTLIFCSDINHCNQIIDKLGVGLSYHSKLSKKEAQKALDYFKCENGVLASVESLNIGFDFPPCDQLINLRPTHSYTLYHQLTRRVARIHKGKKYGYIYDFTFNKFDFEPVQNSFATICMFCGEETDRRLLRCDKCNNPIIRESKEKKDKKCVNGHLQYGRSRYCDICGVQTYDANYQMVELDKISVMLNSQYDKASLFIENTKLDTTKTKALHLIKKIRKGRPKEKISFNIKTTLDTNSYKFIFKKNKLSITPVDFIT